MDVNKDISQIDIWNHFILDGNLNALSNIYLHYYDLLFDYGIRHTNDKQLVEDTIQNMFINFINVRKNIGCVKNLDGYLISTFRRQIFLDFKKQHFAISLDQIGKRKSFFI